VPVARRDRPSTGSHALPVERRSLREVDHVGKHWSPGRFSGLKSLILQPILVLGGTGSLGKPVIERMLADGFCWAGSRRSAGATRNRSRARSDGPWNPGSQGDVHGMWAPPGGCDA